MRSLAKALGHDLGAPSHAYADDAAISSWAKSGVAYVTDRGIMQGVGENRFAPKDKLSYEQAYIMMYRLLNLVR